MMGCASHTHTHTPARSLSIVGGKQTQETGNEKCEAINVWQINIPVLFLPGMNAAVRAVVRMGLYVGAKVYFIHEVSQRSALRAFKDAMAR